MPTEAEQTRLAKALEAVAEEVLDNVVALGVAEHAALVAIKADDEVEVKVVERGDLAQVYASQDVVVRHLQRCGNDPSIVPVVVVDLTSENKPLLTARIPVTTQEEDDA